MANIPNRIEDLIYNHETGQLFRKSVFDGRLLLIGTVTVHGYVVFNINKKKFFAHRVIWEMFNGPIPESMEIDHINNNRQDNRLSNLRLATRAENKHNMVLSKRNRTGVKGVSWNKAYKKWVACLMVEGEDVRSYFFKFEDACKWIAEQREKRHKEFHNHG